MPFRPGRGYFYNCSMKALVIGATGAVGKDLVAQLLADPAFESVTVFVRRPVSIASPKLTVHVVDFDQPAQWHRWLVGDVLFSCLGTTIRAAGSREAQWKVDYTYQYEAARTALAAGCPTLVLVSSIGADPGSWAFYTRMKGQLDADVQALGFPRLFILRPPSLIREGSDRFGEKAGVAVLKVLNALGILRSMRPMPTAAVAAAMVALAKGAPSGTRILTAQEILTAL